MKVLGAVFGLTVVFACAGAQDVTLNQVDWYLNGHAYTNTEWGSPRVDYVGTSQTLYFNLNVNGSWQIENEPLVSAFGPGNHEKLEINFDLGTVRGTNVTSANTGWSITTDLLTQMPAISGSTSVGDRTYRNYFGAPGDGDDPPPPAERSQGGAPALPPAKHRGEVPNQEQNDGECVSGSISNSLNYLYQQGHIFNKPDLYTIPVLNSALGFGTGGWTYMPPGWLQRKQDYLDREGIPVQTNTYGRSQYEQVMNTINMDCDVEIWGYDQNNRNGHVAAVQTITPTANNELKIDVRQDVDQGMEGGTEGNSRISVRLGGLGASCNGSMFAGLPLKYFIVECPVLEPSGLVVVAFGLAFVFVAVRTKGSSSAEG